ncbi:acetyl-CoA hydrolase/transferase family protein [Cyclobacterium qasimii]|uniref:4-hydroxybutyrate coenzyme A transferase n=2 Tax=Cyclobacterium qasimii TaxID=1350429 RepID=S7VKS1_9BACT|nr:acetyl-CoA hydrolase/transferase C-terminal domain-containing protein [Cyclobacterium qasimii]EPR70541.1 4-hydroxybutyrate coenzyme A transferase [Cyclobacterium qasimii M12-11B]GEO22277.1 4-hydroxybutyrate CoA-transferase [Cyclobacterium qasimii]
MKNHINIVNADDAVKFVKSNQRIFIHGSAATPTALLYALAKRKHELKNVEVVSITTLGEMPLADKSCHGSFYLNSLFVSENIRSAINSDQGGYVPVFLSEIGRLFRKNILPIDVAFVHVSPPDQHGYCSLGTSVDVARPAVDTSRMVIAQINKQMPRTMGDGQIHVSKIDAAILVDEPLPEVNYSSKLHEADFMIGKYIAEMIDDRSTLQLGIGGIPDAVLKSLTNHKDLGIHTEMFSDGVIDLYETGVITNKYKVKHPGKIVTSFVIGTKKLYDCIHDNPAFSFHEAAYVNDTAVIRRNPKVISINSCVEIDLTGQVCADSIGSYQYSGVGGQMDFIRGAALSDDGKPIMALRATTNKGQSKIVPFLKQGAGVVTTRAHVHYVVTEYGVAYLYGKNLCQRAHELKKIAAPEHQEELDRAIFERFGNFIYPLG